jgi:hypothetical protein
MQKHSLSGVAHSGVSLPGQMIRTGHNYAAFGRIEDTIFVTRTSKLV